MGFAQGLGIGTQVGNSWVNSYRDAKLKSGLADAGNFTPTEVANGEDALAAAQKARQFQIDQISADDPDFAAKYKQVQDDYAPTMSGLEAQRAKGASNMVQLPGGRRIEQDDAFSPEQMAGLRAEQASKVYSEQGYPEEAAKATMVAQGISKNKMDMDRSALETKALQRQDKRETQWGKQDDLYYSLSDPDMSMDQREKNVMELAKQVGPLITRDNDKFKGVTFKGVENNKQDGMQIVVDQNGETKKVPLTMDMIHQGYGMLAQSRDPAKYADFMQRRMEHQETQAGLDRRSQLSADTQIKLGREQNATSEKVAGIRANAIASRSGSGLSAEDNTNRRAEIADVIDDDTLNPAQKDDMINRINVKYNSKATQLREPGAGQGVGLKDQISSDGMTMVQNGQVFNRSMDGRSWEPVAMPGASNAGGPAPGTVRNGFRFVGGNPNDRNSWEKI